jgi:hypothetical protein
MITEQLNSKELLQIECGDNCSDYLKLLTAYNAHVCDISNVSHFYFV